MTVYPTETEPLHFIIYAPNKKKGLEQDINIISQLISENGNSFEVAVRAQKHDLLSKISTSRKAKFIGVNHFPLLLLKISSWIYRKLRREDHDIAVCLEHIPSDLALHGGPCFLIPNFEWLLETAAWKIPLIDQVLCKTQHAMDIAEHISGRPVYLGFTSRDLYKEGCSPDRSQWLHVASGANQKNSQLIIDLWKARPDFPHLKILGGATGRLKDEEDRPTRNLTIVKEWLSDEDFADTARSSGVHLCPSTAEGFGHTIVEAMSCGALVITSNLPPMNELVDESRGILTEVSETKRWRYGTQGIIEREALEYSIERAMHLSDSDYSNRAAAARSWYIANDEAFRQRFRRIFDSTSGRVTFDPANP